MSWEGSLACSVAGAVADVASTLQVRHTLSRAVVPEKHGKYLASGPVNLSVVVTLSFCSTGVFDGKPKFMSRRRCRC